MILSMQYWVFDLDGTLVDSFPPFFEVLEVIFQQNGKAFPKDFHLPALTESLPLFFERHLGKEAVPGALHLLQEQSNADAARIKTFPGVMETIALLKSKNSK